MLRGAARAPISSNSVSGQFPSGRLPARCRCVHDLWGDVYRKSHGPSNKAKAMGLTVKGESLGSIIAGRNLHRRFQHHSDELSRTIIVLFHHSKGCILVIKDGHLICRTQMQIPEHVTGGKAGDQKLFRIVAGSIATKARIA